MGRAVRLEVISRSMEPMLRRGDHIWVAQASPLQLAQGDLVTFQVNSGVYTHRLIAQDEHTLSTKGDNHFHLDKPVSHTAVFGRVIAIERGGTRLDLRTQQWWPFLRLQGWLAGLEGQTYLTWRRLLNHSGLLSIIVPTRLLQLAFQILHHIMFAVALRYGGRSSKSSST